MFKGKGISIQELRPFSVEDPDGTGRLGPNAAERRIQEIHRRRQGKSGRDHTAGAPRVRREPPSRHDQKPRRPSPESRIAEQNLLSVLKATRRKGRDSPPPATPPHRSAAPRAQAGPKKKNKGCGCFGCLPLLLLLIFFFSVAPQLVDFGIQQFHQQMVRHTGIEAPAQVLSVTETGFALEDDALYELTLAVHLPDGRIIQSTLKQLFKKTAAQHLVLGSWTRVRVNPDDPSMLLVISVGHSEPSVVPRPTRRL